MRFVHLHLHFLLLFLVPNLSSYHSTALETAGHFPEAPLALIPPQLLITGNTTSSSHAMAWRCTGATNAELITNLRKAALIKSSIVADAMARVDRAHYAPRRAYEDSPQAIGFGATISAPHMHAAACESLLPFLRPGAKVLDVGSGSGYLTAVMAEILGLEGKVVGIDHIPGLVELSRKNMQKSEAGRQLLESQRVELICGDGRLGYPAAAPYDAIHVGAAARELHESLVEQLKSPGRMFIPVGEGSQWIWVVDKDDSGKVSRRKDMGVVYVPLTDAPA